MQHLLRSLFPSEASATASFQVLYAAKRDTNPPPPSNKPLPGRRGLFASSATCKSMLGKGLVLNMLRKKTYAVIFQSCRWLAAPAEQHSKALKVGWLGREEIRAQVQQGLSESARQEVQAHPRPHPPATL